jgi:pimeloyl-ACP methyl ester carboxylesterase
MDQVAVDDSVIHFEETGTGKPLVLLHGLSGSGRWWERNVPFLAERFHVYVIDLIGFGASRGQPFVLRRAADLLRQWLDALEIEQLAAVGHSMGGFIAADLTIRFPERVEQLVLVDAAALPIGRPLWRHGWDMVRALRYMPLDFLPVLVQDAWHAGPATLIRAMQEIRQTDLAEQLDQIAVPTLVVWGENDTLLDPLVGRALARSVAQAQLALIPGAGHNPMWDRPAHFNQLVVEFLEEGGRD